METNTASVASPNVESVTQLVPGASNGLAHVSNEELLRRTRQLVGKSNQVFAALLEHLAEVEARGLHRTRSCTSLYTYCIYELRFSEDAAARRAGAAKLVKRFPVALHSIARGELHLTGLLMLGPHLTEANCADVLARAKFRTKKEIGKLLRSLAPLPDVPDSIEPLRPALPRSLRRPTWEEFVQSFCPPVRELKPGERPSDWANDTASESSTESGRNAEDQPGSTTAPARVADLPEVPPDLPPITGPQVYQMQFTTTEEHVELVERAQGLLSQKATLGELHLQAMRLLVETLEKRRFGAERRHPRQRSLADGDGAQAKSQHPRQRGSEEGESELANSARTRQRRARTEAKSRYIPAAKRRAVFERDEGRCTYVDERGQRCRETRHLEIDHLLAFAKGGEDELANLRLRCHAHNALTAEEDFGREHIERKRHSRHESLRVATTAHHRG